MRLLLTRADIPPIAWQAPFPGRQPGARRVDGLVESWRLVVEADGRAWHERVRDFERDRRRDAEVAAAGLQTLRFTWHQITAERSEEHTSELQSLMRISYAVFCLKKKKKHINNDQAYVR